jgi:nitroreductase
MADLDDTIGRQRAHRAFRPDEVDDALVDRILTAAGMAPSAYNSQPWEWIVVRDPATRAAIGEIAARVWDAVPGEWRDTHLAPSMAREVEDGAHGGIAAAPVLVVVCVDRRRCDRGAIGSSIFPAVQNLLLAATAAGLGSALTTLATHDPGLASLLGLPDHVEAMAVVPLGWPAKPLGPPRRDPLSAHRHAERW